MKSKFNTIFQQIMSQLTNNYQLAKQQIIDALHNPPIGYGYYDTINDKVINDDDKNNPLPDQVWNNYKLMSPETTLKIHLGVCWDCVLVIDQILNKYNIQHKNILLYGGGDQYTTHTTTIFKQNGIWYWCDNGWGNHIYGGQNQSDWNWYDEDQIELIKRIKQTHQNDMNLTDEVYIVDNYPPVGSSAQQFIQYAIENNEKVL